MLLLAKNTLTARQRNNTVKSQNIWKYSRSTFWKIPAKNIDQFTYKNMAILIVYLFSYSISRRPPFLISLFKNKCMEVNYLIFVWIRFWPYSNLIFSSWFLKSLLCLNVFFETMLLNVVSVIISREVVGKIKRCFNWWSTYCASCLYL